jgi:hypothetical protein
MANDRSTGSWAKVAGQPGIYRRVEGSKPPPQDQRRSAVATQAVETLKTQLDTLIAQTKARLRS